MKSRNVGLIGAAMIVAAACWAGLYHNQINYPSPTPVPHVVQDDRASIVIKAPEKASAGELVIISVEESNAASFSWTVVPETKDFLVIDGGKRAVFSHGASVEFLFIIAGAKGDTVDVKIHKVTINGGPAKPGDDLEAKIGKWCEKIDYPEKRDDTLKLGQSFLSLASTFSSGVVATPDEMVAATVKSNRQALGSNVEKWVPFLEGLQAELKAQAQAGALPDAAAHAAIWKRTGEALLAYAKTL